MSQLIRPLIATLVCMTASIAQAQVVVTPAPAAGGWWYGAPGYYGTAWGYSSYGMPRAYSTFNSPFGPGYAYGYSPASFAPGPFGWGLWRPAYAAPGYVYSPSPIYRTTGGIGTVLPYGQGPPFSAYAPTYAPGRGGFVGW